MDLLVRTLEEKREVAPPLEIPLRHRRAGKP